ncbi:hypothetical protein NDU88_003235 [Pleurodeles waltl]|uniref:Uncharacterized protein n=1 Tax=Pleurodeles waltl TaxID=8319 RepID=A0AAV7M6C5_PLEWA|nr:hypothetical protein NDU88_003235 [Pleurodeles waltl]
MYAADPVSLKDNLHRQESAPASRSNWVGRSRPMTRVVCTQGGARISLLLFVCPTTARGRHQLRKRHGHPTGPNFTSGPWEPINCFTRPR